jgi:hypothetical protein
MKRLAILLLINLSVAPATVGAAGTCLGKIGDSHCGPSHKNGPPTGGQTLNDEGCTELCVGSGAKYVLVTGDGVYSIANQKFKGLGSSVGKTVQVDGDLEGTTITVTKISPVHKKAPKRN